MAYKISQRTWSQLHHFASFPQTGISLRQMVQFGRNLNPGTVLQAGTFLAEELPIRLAHRVKELDELPNGLNEMPSIIKVKNWYAQSFEELVSFPKAELPGQLRELMGRNVVLNAKGLEENSKNLAVDEVEQGIVEGYGASHPGGERMTPMRTRNEGATVNGNGVKRRIPLQYRYYSDHTNVEHWPPEVVDYNERFTRALEMIKRRHDPVVTTVAQGVLEYKRAKRGKNVQADIQRFLDRFYMSRIGIRILIGQQIALARTCPNAPGNKASAGVLGSGSAAGGSIGSSLGGGRSAGAVGRAKPPAAGGVVGGAGGSSAAEEENFVGIICTNTNVGQIAQEAIENARYVAEEHYGLFKGPPVELICPKDLTFMYIPSHLNHMLFELMKNSLRATIERFQPQNEDNFPPIKVIIVEGKEDITIKISDEGGGIPRSELPLVWTYMYTTATSEDLDPDFQGSDFKAPMAGYGYGLPLSRLYARYFGGDLRIETLEGFGLDSYIHLNRLSSSEEPLP